MDSTTDSRPVSRGSSPLTRAIASVINEGQQPSCLRVVVFEGRGASLRDRTINCGGEHRGKLYFITSGTVVPCVLACGHQHAHPDVKWHYIQPSGPWGHTNDKVRAERVFAQAEQWVLTGASVEGDTDG